MPVDDEMLHAMRARAREARDQFERLAGVFGDLQQDIQAVSVTAVSRDGLVRVTIGHDGRVRDLQLDSRIYRNADSSKLARTILDTIEVATVEARQRVMELCKPHVPAGALEDYASGNLKQAMVRLQREMPSMGEVMP
jgi:DNA-binding protein YbaB